MNPKWRALDFRSPRVFGWWLAGVITITHLYALFIFGSTFWIDCVSYVSLGNALWHRSALASFYQTNGGLLYSHVGVGIPAVWSLLTTLPESWRWPVLAIFQHVFAGVSLYFAVINLHRIIPSLWHLVATVLLCLLPFYQSLHNALLTESITSSLLLIGFGYVLRLYHDSLKLPDFCGLLISLFLLVQFRSYCGGMVLLMALAVLFRKRKRVSLLYWSLLPAVFALAVVAFPLARYLATGWFSMPSAGVNRLVCAFWANSRPSPKLMESLRVMPQPASRPFEAAEQGRFSYSEAVQLGEFWRKEGLTPTQLIRRANLVSQQVLDDTPEVFLTRIRFGLSACGFGALGFTGKDHGELYQSITASEQRSHQLQHYRLLSWIDADSHRKALLSYFQKMPTLIPDSQRCQEQLLACLQPYVSRASRFLRDPLRLGQLPCDVWAALGLLGALFLVVRRPILAIVFVIPFFVNFATTFALPLPGIRYAYALIPFFFFSVSAALASIRAKKKEGDAKIV